MFSNDTVWAPRDQKSELRTRESRSAMIGIRFPQLKSGKQTILRMPWQPY